MNMKKEVKRPRDANQLAKFIVDVATGEQESSREVEPVNTFAQGSMHLTLRDWKDLISLFGGSGHSSRRCL